MLMSFIYLSCQLWIVEEKLREICGILNQTLEAIGNNNPNDNMRVTQRKLHRRVKFFRAVVFLVFLINVRRLYDIMSLSHGGAIFYIQYQREGPPCADEMFSMPVIGANLCCILFFFGFPLNRRLTKKKVVPIEEEKKDPNKSNSSSWVDPELAKDLVAKAEDGDVRQENVAAVNDEVHAPVAVGSNSQERKRLKFENKSDYFRDEEIIAQ